MNGHATKSDAAVLNTESVATNTSLMILRRLWGTNALSEVTMPVADSLVSRSAKALSVELSNEYFKSLGLPTLIDEVQAYPTRTAAYGPIRTVMWQGSVGDRRPYADQVAFTEVIPLQKPTPNEQEAKLLKNWNVKRRTKLAALGSTAYWHNC